MTLIYLSVVGPKILYLLSFHAKCSKKILNHHRCNKVYFPFHWSIPGFFFCSQLLLGCNMFAPLLILVKARLKICNTYSYPRK